MPHALSRMLLAGYAAATCLLPVGTQASEPHALRVMTLNIRYPSNDDGPDQWTYRRGCVAGMIRDASPDIIAVQEAFKLQVDALADDLEDYAWVGRSRYGNQSNEYIAIFYRRTRFALVATGDFWLSDKPESAGSISWGHPLPRMVTWAHLRELGGAHSLRVLNTHFPWRSQDADARARSAKLIRARIQAMGTTDPVVLAGDFNTPPDTEPHGVFSGILSDAWLAAPLQQGPEGTWHAFKGVPQTRIDWIFSRGLRPMRVQTIADACPNGRYPSDHFPVQAAFEFPADSP